MPVEYTDEQNQVFIDCIEEYRDLIEGESAKETERLSTAFAKQLMKTSPLLSSRTPNGIAERLVYFDNLLAGVTFPYEYYLAGTYETYYGKLPRKSGRADPNKWRAPHEARREKQYKIQSRS